MQDERKKLRIIFISYWSIADSLTTATIMPWLRLMQQDEHVESVHMVTVERDEAPINITFPSLSKIQHCPLLSLNNKWSLITKVSDFKLFPRLITQLSVQAKANILFAQGSLAGALGYKVCKNLTLPLYVSSFEPHADYMAESGVWNRKGLKYIFQKYWERQQMSNATGLLPVAENYKRYLLKQGVHWNKLKTVPSPVDLIHSAFNPQIRDSVRSNLQLADDNIVGIYVGKYEGLYYNGESFQIYQQCFKQIPNFRLIILSPQPKRDILNQLNKYDINPAKVFVDSVPHAEVPSFLSAADFAFATYKLGPSKKYLSPVKIGEYWANGLPVLLTEGVGDDSDIIKNEGGGALFNLEQLGSVEKAIRQILTIVQEPTHRQEIPRLAEKYRSMEQVREAYEYFFKQQPEI